MSELLQNWLNNEVGLSTNVSNFEKDFATGFLLGEILHKFRQQVDFDQFQNKNTYEVKIANFKRLEPTFKALGIKFNATQSNAVMNSERGAALRLLYQLKMAAERLVLATSASADVQAGGTGAVTKGIRVPRDQYDGHERRFFEHRLRATCLNVKQAREAKVTKKFELEKHKQEVVAFEMDNIEMAHMDEQRQIHRFSLQERLRQNKAAKEDWEAHSHQLWQENMQVRLMRESADAKFNERVFQKQKEKSLNARDLASTDVKKGVKEFESTLATLGLSKELEARAVKGIPDEESSEDEDEDNDTRRRGQELLNQTTKAGTAKDLVEALQSRLPSSQELEHEAGLFMRKIKESKHAGSIARRERERRRRRVLVEQQREQEMLEESQLEEVLLEKLARESVEEAAISYSTWRTRTMEEVFVRNRGARKQSYNQQRKDNREEAIRRDQEVLQEMVETMREQEERERVRYRAIERGRHAKRRAKLCEEMENIQELVIHMAFAALQQEQLTDESEVDETLWNEWMALFEANVPVTSLPSLGDCASEPAPLAAMPDMDTSPPSDPRGITLNTAALREYVESKGQWEASKPLVSEEEAAAAEDPRGDDPEAAAAVSPAVGGFDVVAEVKKAIQDVPELPFADKLSTELDFVDGRPVNYRLGVVVASMLDRTYVQPPQPPPPRMPEVPLKLVITGKALAGKKKVAERLAEAYNLQVIETAAVVRECLHLSKRPDISAENPVDVLSFAGDAAEDFCQRQLEQGNPYFKELQEIGYDIQRLLDNGEAIKDEMYVHMIVTKIRSLFPDDIPKEEDTLAEGSAAEAGAATSPDGGQAEPRGWVLVGFPDDGNRLALLERFLSGFVDPLAEPTPKAVEMKAEAELIAPKPPEEQPPLVRKPGGYDLHFRLDLTLDESVRRAAGRCVDPVTNLEYHIEDHPPPSEKTVIYERLVPVDGLAKSMGTLTQRIHKFDTSQPEVDEILQYFGPFPDVPRLVEVDSSGSVDQTYEALEEQVALLLERKQAEEDQRRAAAEAEAAAKAAAEEEARAAEEAKAAEEAAAKAAAAADPEAAAAADAAAAAAAAPAESSEPESTGPPVEPPFEPVQLTDLSKNVEKIEDAVFELLVEEWRELQGDFTTSLQQLFGWHRAHLADFRAGIYGIKQRFAEYLQRTDNRQALLDDFVQRFNAFTEEYPDMRKQDLTKDELHQRADELHSKLRNEVESRRTENLQQLEIMKTNWWVESQTEVLASQVQHVVQLEVRRYHNACQLLTDFYYSSLCLGLPEAHAPPPRVDCFAAEETDEAAPDPKGKAKAAPKGKKGSAAESEEPVISPEEKAALRLCKWVAPTSAEELPDGETEPTEGHWEFPFLSDVMTQARNALWELEAFKPPTVEVPEQEEAPDPKAKAKPKAKGKADKKKGAEEEVAAPPQPAPPLFVDLQQALLAERATFTHRLSTIQDWAQRRLLQVATTSKSTFEHLKDWVVLRRQKELDAAEGLIGIIKEHIEDEVFIKTKLSLENAHLHRRPNVLLRAPDPPVVPPPVEGISPFRWTIAQLHHLLEVVSNAAFAVSPQTRMLPAITMLSIMQQLTTPGEGTERKPLNVPANWRNCPRDRLQTLVHSFEQPHWSGSVDVVEFLLHIGLLHSPLGWPSTNTLLEVRKVLEPQAPKGSAWPDFYVTQEQLLETPIFADPRKDEESFSKKFKPVTQDEPGLFDRARSQLEWVGKVLGRFAAPSSPEQAWELEAAWYDYKVRKAEHSDRLVELLDDVRTTPSDTPRQPAEMMPALLGGPEPDPDSANEEDLHSDLGGMSVESGGRPERPRPEAPELPERPSRDAVSVRQLLTYLCQGTTAEDGLARATAVLAPEMPGPSGAGSVPAAAAHAAMLQLGARPTPSSNGGDARPAYPALQKFCEELDYKHNGSVRTTEMVGKAEAQEMLKSLGLGKRHRRVEVDKLFPKSK
eukprot:TRINITY_DN20871_c0_g1_i1.p1 TRINITY_DN20871_c0_g1~~TRINITY_DN20871_c0_g1_i1.p1  ORF type:complete len:1954 (-),score=553.23 TRINITY_DN20871_c0_g1_i1:93-5921(-)